MYVLINPEFQRVLYKIQQAARAVCEFSHLLHIKENAEGALLIQSLPSG